MKLTLLIVAFCGVSYRITVAARECPYTVEADGSIRISPPWRESGGHHHGDHNSRVQQHITDLPLHCKPEGAKLAELSYFSNIKDKPDMLDSILHGILEVHPTGTWLQIGSNTLDPDGPSQKIYDPLLDMLPSFQGYHKIFVEPIPDLFQQLQQNVQQLGLQNTSFVNAAVLAENGPEQVVDIFCAPEDIWDGFRVGGCSLSADKIRNELAREPRQLQVPAMSVSTLFEKQEISDVRIVLIDVEGFDDKVLYQLPFAASASFRPSLVVFERLFLNQDGRLEAAKEFLHSHCYMVVTNDMDAFAVPYIS